MAQGDFEKRRKGVESIFKGLFWLNIILAIGLGVLMFIGQTDILIYPIVVYCVAAVLMFFTSRLAHKGSLAAGIIGIIVGLLELSAASVLSTIIGILLLIDSILYIVYYKKQ